MFLKEVVKVNYEYGLSFVLGGDDDEIYKGLGFEFDVGLSGSFFVFKVLGDEENCEEGGDEVMFDVVKVKLFKRNLGFIFIGGMKFYIEDIFDDEESGGEEEEGSIGFEESEELFESESLDDMFGSDVEIDDVVVKDYLEGIGGSENMLDVYWLVEKLLD